MAKTVFLSPSREKSVIGNGEYGTELRRMNELGNIIEAELERHGVFVEREGNEVDIPERIKAANEMKADLYISLHSNAAPEEVMGTVQGTEIYITPDNEDSLKIAKNIYKMMKFVPGFIGRGIRKNKAFIELNICKMPSCVIFVDFHDNYDRSCWITENMRDIALSITKGILSYFEMEYIPKTNSKYYRVQIGAFKNKSNAEKVARNLIDAGYPVSIKYY